MIQGVEHKQAEVVRSARGGGIEVAVTWLPAKGLRVGSDLGGGAVVRAVYDVVQRKCSGPHGCGRFHSLDVVDCS